ncbi:cytochrome oxidase complex assembly protein 1-domain-containing protein [Cytidiella melzeri]|nr:cytochrome oxidase complex assembly protein 1-domain-containing protein [Cytidiella melzeri]
MNTSTLSRSLHSSARLKSARPSSFALRAFTSVQGNATASASTKPSPAKLPEAEIFSEPAKPREYYTRPQRDLPPIQRSWPIIVLVSVLGVSTWGAFYLYAANQERLSSSVVRQVMGTVRDSAALKEALGDSIRFEPVWWLNGDPYINGGVHLMQGSVDLSFRIKGHKGQLFSYAYIRRAKGEPFTILRFRIICDDGKIVEMPTNSFTA